MKTCPYCKDLIKDESKYCASCENVSDFVLEDAVKTLHKYLNISRQDAEYLIDEALEERKRRWKKKDLKK